MKKLHFTNILIFLAAFTVSASADDALPASKPVTPAATAAPASTSGTPSTNTNTSTGASASTTTDTSNMGSDIDSGPSAPGTTNLTAPVATDASQIQIDPTLAFFSALSNCTPGQYTEKNILSSEVGTATLNQQIVGLSDDQASCNANLSTPDGRTLTCTFPIGDLNQLNDQHFLQGMLADTTDEPSQDSLNADMVWSQMKANYCSF